MIRFNLDRSGFSLTSLVRRDSAGITKLYLNLAQGLPGENRLLIASASTAWRIST
jgi:hypothetical protein